MDNEQKLSTNPKLMAQLANIMHIANEEGLFLDKHIDNDNGLNFVREFVRYIVAFTIKAQPETMQKYKERFDTSRSNHDHEAFRQTSIEYYEELCDNVLSAALDNELEQIKQYVADLKKEEESHE